MEAKFHKLEFYSKGELVAAVALHGGVNTLFRAMLDEWDEIRLYEPDADKPFISEMRDESEMQAQLAAQLDEARKEIEKLKAQRDGMDLDAKEWRSVADRLRLQIRYPDPEGMPDEEAAKFCPFKDPLHFHHDGCPSEWAYVEKGTEKINKLQADLDAARADARKWYHADGTFELLDPEEVVRRRIAAAKHIADLEAALREAQPLVKECWPTSTMDERIDALLAPERGE